VELIHFAQDRGKLWGFVNVVRRLWVSINAVNFFAGQYFVLCVFLVDWFELRLISYTLGVTSLRFFGGIPSEVPLNLCEICGKGSGTLKGSLLVILSFPYKSVFRHCTAR